MSDPDDTAHEWVNAPPPADWLNATAEQTQRLWRAIVLAPTLEVCEAMLRGQPVPRSALDPNWARRLGV